MSRTTLYAAGPDGIMQPVAEYRNAWWSAMAVWTFMIERYLRAEKPSGPWLGDPAFLERLWRLIERDDIPFIERVTLATTYDRWLVRGSERELLYHCMKSFATLLAPEAHINQQAEDIRALPPETRAVGWQQTSVAENLWFVAAEDRDYNIDVDTEHTWLFEAVLPGGGKMPEEKKEPLFVSDHGEIRLFPEYPDLIQAEPPPWEIITPELPPSGPGIVTYRRLPVDDSPLQEGIRRLIRERDEAREQVQFLACFAEETLMAASMAGPLTYEVRALFQRWNDLWRLLEQAEWFRNGPPG